MASIRIFRPWQLVFCLAILMPVVAIWSTRQIATYKAGKEQLHILCTFLPVYIFTLNIVGDAPGVTVELLAPANLGCPHDYSLRSQDLKRAANADVIVAHGQGIDAFAEQLARSNPKAQLITITKGWYGFPLHPIQSPNNEKDKLESENNPHMWVGLANAIRMAHTLKFELMNVVHDSRLYTFGKNGDAFIGRLERFVVHMQDTSKHFKNRNIVTFHPAFDYLAADLNLNIVATLTDEPDHLPSAHHIAEVIDTIKRTHPAAIFYEPAHSDRLPQMISRETNVPIYPLNPVTSTDGPVTIHTYEEIMEQNLTVLQKALGTKP